METSTPTHEWLVDLVGHAATREFDVVFHDWAKECRESNENVAQTYETALLLFAAGYIARRNDELQKENA